MQTNKLVVLLTEVEKNLLLGQQYAPDSYFNPIQDADDNWIISTEEQEFCVHPDFYWIKFLSLIPYNPKVGPIP